MITATTSNTKLQQHDDSANIRLKTTCPTFYDKLNPLSPHFDFTFPKLINFGASVTGFIEAEIENWLALRIAVRRNARSTEGGL